MRVLSAEYPAVTACGPTPGPGKLHGTRGSCCSRSPQPGRVYLLFFLTEQPGLAVCPSRPAEPLPLLPGQRAPCSLRAAPPGSSGRPRPAPTAAPARPPLPALGAARASPGPHSQLAQRPEAAAAPLGRRQRHVGERGGSGESPQGAAAGGGSASRGGSGARAGSGARRSLRGHSGEMAGGTGRAGQREYISFKRETVRDSQGVSALWVHGVS